MTDKEERKKKKKSKKAEEAAPEPAAPVEEEEQWPPADIEEPAEEPVEAVEDEQGGEPAGEQEEGLMEEFPEAIEKKRSPYPVFWDRPKSRFYRINFDYGENYYRDMMDYLNNRAGVGKRVVMPPPAKSWAERAHRSASQRYPTQNSDITSLLTNIRSSIRSYENHHRQYTATIQQVYGPKAI